jgi:hypothetical protein
LGDRTDAEHREGGREILRHRRERRGEGRVVTLSMEAGDAEEREFSEFDSRG